MKLGELIKKIDKDCYITISNDNCILAYFQQKDAGLLIHDKQLIKSILWGVEKDIIIMLKSIK